MSAHRIMTILLVSLIAMALTSASVLGETTQSQLKNPNTKDLGFSKNFFFTAMQSELTYNNLLLGSSIQLDNDVRYYPFSEQIDGWACNFDNGMGYVGVAGPEEAVTKAFYVVRIYTENDTILLNNAAALIAFEKILFPNEPENTQAGEFLHNEESQQSEPILVGDKFIQTSYEFKGNHYLFSVFVYGQPKQDAPLPWWTILGIIGTTISLSTFAWKMVGYFKKRSANKLVR